MNAVKGKKGFIAMPIEERFWAKVCKANGDGCWEWNGSTDGRYGAIWMNGRLQKAHRVSYEMQVGLIPAGLSVCHSCDNPRCVRPDHLFLGTQSDNLLDATAKGRNGAQVHPERLARGSRNGMHTQPERRSRGEENGMAKLTTDQVREIRHRYKPRKINHRRLAAEYGVSPSTILDIFHRRTWSHV